MQKKVDVLAYAMQQLAEYRGTGFTPALPQELAERVAKLEDEVLLLNILLEGSKKNGRQTSLIFAIFLNVKKNICKS